MFMSLPLVLDGRSLRFPAAAAADCEPKEIWPGQSGVQ